MNNIKTTLLGLGQWLVVGVFLFAKLKSGASFSDAEMALLTSVVLSGAKGIVAADAKKDGQ